MTGARSLGTALAILAAIYGAIWAVTSPYVYLHTIAGPFALVAGVIAALLILQPAGGRQR